MVYFLKLLHRMLDWFEFGIVLIALFLSCYALHDTFSIYADAYRRPDLKTGFAAGEESEISFSSLAEAYPEMVGWITVDDTGIDGPVMQCGDNEKYVSTSYDGSYAISGSIFLDCRNSSDFSDPYSLLYGHHMEYGMMFGDVVRFMDEDYFHMHQTGILKTEEGDYDIRFFACMETDCQDEVIFSPDLYNDFDFLMSYLSEYSTVYTDAEKTGHIIALSTCTEAGSFSRTVLFGLTQ